VSIGRRPPGTSSAVIVYVIILVSLQVFTITVAVEAFLTDEAIAWATAGVSVALAGLAAAFLRYLRP
jgi:positive regulator of sigma E activity